MSESAHASSLMPHASCFKHSCQPRYSLYDPLVALLREREPHRVPAGAVNEEWRAGDVGHAAFHRRLDARGRVDVRVQSQKGEQTAIGRCPGRDARETIFESGDESGTFAAVEVAYPLDLGTQPTCRAELVDDRLTEHSRAKVGGL